jgi:predicted membrane protein
LFPKLPNSGPPTFLQRAVIYELKMVIKSIITGRQPKNLRSRKNGTFEFVADGEPVEDAVSNTVEGEREDLGDLGRVKWVKKANHLYTVFWKHNDNDGSDKEDGA